MKKYLLLFSLFGCVCMAFGQSKKELQAELSELRTTLAETKAKLQEANKSEASSSARAAAIELELAELRETNTMLLKNLNQITEDSHRRTENIGKSLENLQLKERQLRSINDAMTRNDSISLLILTSLKQTLGENARIVLSNNAVSVVMDNSFLFGADDQNLGISAEALPFLEKIAGVINRNPDRLVSVVSYSNAIDFPNAVVKDNADLSALRATAVSRALTEDGVAAQRLLPQGKGKSESMSIETATHIRIHPQYESFYSGLREQLKNGN